MSTVTAPQQQSSSVINIFDEFRAELDDYSDRRERLIKASRDVTNLSKKIIFLLHRIMTEDTEGTDHSLSQRAASAGREKLAEVTAIYADLKHDLQGDRFWRYHRCISPSIQEFTEALSFMHYLEHGTLVTFGDVQRTLSDVHGVPYFTLPLDDYLLGLSDLTGELMRFAISGISRRGGRSKASDVCAFVRHCKADLERLTPYVRELSRKQYITAQSLEKIEDAAYAMVVRGSEYDLPPERLDDIVALSVSSFSGRDRRHKRAKGGNEDNDET